MAERSPKRLCTEGPRPVVIIGLGQLGQTFASGFLRLGRPVFPVLRGDSLQVAAGRCSDPAVVIVAVGENDLEGVLSSMPSVWNDRLVLLQNELLPPAWKAHSIDPTVFVCWYEKKQHSALLQPSGAPSQAFGAHAQLLLDAHHALNIKCSLISSQEEVLEALIAKAVLILAINICGLALHNIKEPYVGGTFDQLLVSHRELFNDVSAEAMSIQEALCGIVLEPQSRQRIVTAVLRMMESVPEHRNCGRVAADRLRRAVSTAAGVKLAVPTMQRILSERCGS